MRDQTCFIPDGREYFQTSVVTFVRFKSFELQSMFAYLRERESILQKDLKRFHKEPEEIEKTIELRTVESMLIWMAHNLAGEGLISTRMGGR